MIRRHVILLAALILLGLGWGSIAGDDASAKAPSRARAPWRIMPLGDSITQGDCERASYRRPLWLRLKEAGLEVDFVGSLRRNHRGGPPVEDFDVDHEGHWGWRADQVLREIDGWARAAQADVALMLLGVNDLFQGASVSQVLRSCRHHLRAARDQPKNYCPGRPTYSEQCGRGLSSFNESLKDLAGRSTTRARS